MKPQINLDELSFIGDVISWLEKTGCPCKITTTSGEVVYGEDLSMNGSHEQMVQYEDQYFSIEHQMDETIFETVVAVLKRNFGQIVYIKDTNLRYTFANGAWQNLFGDETIEGKRQCELVSAPIFSMEHEIEVLMNKECISYNRTFFHEMIIYHYSAEVLPLIDSTGELIGIMSSVDLEYAEEESSDIFTTAGLRIQKILDDLGIFYEEDGIYTNYLLDLSNNFMDYLGYDESHYHYGYFPVWPYIHHGDCLLWVDKQAEMMRNEISAFRTVLRFMDNESNWKWFRNFTMIPRYHKTGAPAFKVCALIDVTDLMSYRKRIEESYQRKVEFLSNMSHEMRTPMNGIIGFNQLLLETKLNLQQRNYVHFMHDASLSLLRLVNDILDYAKIDAGMMKLNIRSVHMVKFLEAIEEQLMVLSKSLKVSFSMTFDFNRNLLVKIDENRLEQVLLNLLSQCIRSNPKGIVTLTVTVGEHIRFIVEDSNQRFMNTSFKSKVMAERELIENATEASDQDVLKGSIAVKLLNLMNTNLEISRNEMGVSYAFNIPLVYGTSSKGENFDNKDTKSVKHLRKKVLIVDDLETNRLLIQEHLKPMGIAFDVATDGIEAIEQVEHNHYDLVLMDLQMPNMNGIEATKQIRKKHDEKEVPIVAMTADTGKMLQRRTMSCGMQDWIEKPIELGALYKVLNEYLNERDSYA